MSATQPEAMLDAVGAGGVGQSIKPQIQADTVIQVSVPTGWKLVPVEPTDDMFIEGMEADCRGRPSIDDDNHVRSIWRAMLSSAPDAPRPPAQSCCTCTKTADLHKAPAPAQQEPVAWRVHPFDYGVGSDGVYALTMRTEQVEMWRRKGWKVEPLYTAPQPDRQPLTDERILSIVRAAPALDTVEAEFLHIARTIEAAHGITVGQQ